jgi:hypothetical protein
VAFIQLVPFRWLRPRPIEPFTVSDIDLRTSPR